VPSNALDERDVLRCVVRNDPKLEAKRAFAFHFSDDEIIIFAIATIITVKVENVHFFRTIQPRKFHKPMADSIVRDFYAKALALA
jgi:hypothetical protein